MGAVMEQVKQMLEEIKGDVKDIKNDIVSFKVKSENRITKLETKWKIIGGAVIVIAVSLVKGFLT
jgi:hypothetical protein